MSFWNDEIMTIFKETGRKEKTHRDVLDTLHDYYVSFLNSGISKESWCYLHECNVDSLDKYERILSDAGYPLEITKKSDGRGKRAERLGEVRTMNCGYDAEIVKYDNANDITVMFDDRTIVKHRTYNSFRNGSIKKPLTEEERSIGAICALRC